MVPDSTDNPLQTSPSFVTFIFVMGPKTDRVSDTTTRNIYFCVSQTTAIKTYLNVISPRFKRNYLNIDKKGKDIKLLIWSLFDI